MRFAESPRCRRRQHASALLGATALLFTACSGTGATPTTLDIPPSSVTITAETTTSTLASPPRVVPRFPAGRLAPGRHAATTFDYPFEMTLPPGTWSTDGETTDMVHILQAEVPDFGGSIFYDWPGIVVLAYPDQDDQALAARLDGIVELEVTSSEPAEIGARPAVRVEAQTAGNPQLDLPTSDAGSSFAGLGGYWFWDPEIGDVHYLIYLVDMGEGSLLIWYSALADDFDARVGAAIDAIESIRFL